MLTATQITTAARAIAKCPGFTSQSGIYLNLVLNDLVLHRDLKMLRKQHSIAVSVGSNGPFALPTDYLRTYDLFYTVNNFVKQQPSIKNLYYDHPFNFTPVAWAVSKGNVDLVNVINTGINILTLSGRYDDMARPYFDAGALPVGYIETPQLEAFPRPLLRQHLQEP